MLDTPCHPQQTPQRIAAPKPLIAHYLPGRSTRLVVSLSGVGNRRTSTRGGAQIEFLGTASAGGENHVLFVFDQSRSWMNAPSLPQALRALVEETKARYGLTEVLALGDSMGGFMALRLAELTQIDQVAAFSPQVSVHPRIVPEEQRWWPLRRRIETWRVLDVGALAQPGTSYYIFHGAAAKEAPHWQRFPWSPRLNHFIFARRGHRLAGDLRDLGLLGPIFAEVQKDRPRCLRRLLERARLGRGVTVQRREALEGFGLAPGLLPKDGAPKAVLDAKRAAPSDGPGHSFQDPKIAPSGLD